MRMAARMTARGPFPSATDRMAFRPFRQTSSRIPGTWIFFLSDYAPQYFLFRSVLSPDSPNSGKIPVLRPSSTSCFSLFLDSKSTDGPFFFLTSFLHGLMWSYLEVRRPFFYSFFAFNICLSISLIS